MTYLELDRAVTEGATAGAMERRLTHLLDSIAPFTVGAEEEYILVDPDTLLPVDSSDETMTCFDGDRRIATELFRCQVEGVSPVCVSVADVARELRAVRRMLGRRLAGTALPIAVGTHPTSLDPGRITDAVRYEGIALANPIAARRSLTCGMHVHVAVGGAERTLGVFNALRSYLPLVAALAANAPFHEGEDTRMASVRPTLLRYLPRTGTPPAFRSLLDYAEFLVWTRSSGAHDAKHHWWDARIHPAIGTVEVRVADVPTRIEDTAAIIALVQSLVFWLAARDDAGEVLEVHPTERIEENARLAARDGVHGLMAGLGNGTPVPTDDVLLELVETVRPAALVLGCEAELGGVEKLLREGGGPARQRLVAESEGVDGMMHWIASQTLGGKGGTAVGAAHEPYREIAYG